MEERRSTFIQAVLRRPLHYLLREIDFMYGRFQIGDWVWHKHLHLFGQVVEYPGAGHPDANAEGVPVKFIDDPEGPDHVREPIGGLLQRSCVHRLYDCVTCKTGGFSLA